MAVSLVCLLTFAALSLVSASGVIPTCKDLDATACVLLHKQKPDLCTDAIFSNTACMRFCGKCPLYCYDCASPVRDPSLCNTTKACPGNQTCMTKHFRAADGHHEYIMSCETNRMLCQGLGFGFGVGKRDFGSRSVSYRDISFECCDTDMCNNPTSTTVPPQTTPTTPVTTVNPIHGCNKDIVFVLDDSGSIGLTNFRHAIDFVRAIINGIDIGPHNSQVGLLVFSSHPQSVWHLNSFPSKASLISASGKLKYYGGSTRTHEALDYVRTTMLTPQHGDRTSVDNVVIVITDGRSIDTSHTQRSARLLHQVSRDVVGIEIGNTNEQEILTIATSRNHMFDLQHYSAILSIVPNVINLVCYNHP